MNDALASQLASLAAGLITFFASLFTDQSKAKRRERALDVGNRLTQFAVANFEAREKAGLITDADKQAFKLELDRIRNAVNAEFYSSPTDENVYLQSSRTPLWLLVVRSFFAAAIILFITSTFGTLRSGSPATDQERLLRFDLTMVGAVSVVWILLEIILRFRRKRS